jgi:hypothetical protein
MFEKQIKHLEQTFTTHVYNHCNIKYSGLLLQYPYKTFATYFLNM